MTYHWKGKPDNCKLLRIEAEIENETIRRLVIKGDFFAHPEEGFERLEASLSGTEVSKVASRVRSFCERENLMLYGVTPEGIEEGIRKAVDENAVS